MSRYSMSRHAAWNFSVEINGSYVSASSILVTMLDESYVIEASLFADPIDFSSICQVTFKDVFPPGGTINSNEN